MHIYSGRFTLTAVECISKGGISGSKSMYILNLSIKKYFKIKKHQQITLPKGCIIYPPFNKLFPLLIEHQNTSVLLFG